MLDLAGMSRNKYFIGHIIVPPVSVTKGITSVLKVYDAIDVFARDQQSNNYSATIPEVCVSAIVVPIVDPAVLMALRVMVYVLSSLRPLRVCALMEPSEMVSVRGAPCGAEHLLTV